MPYWASLIGALLLALPFVIGEHLDVAHVHHRRGWISIAAGTSVAYVFVYILPELSEMQDRYAETVSARLIFLDYHVYLVALLGFVLFYGLDTMVVADRTAEHSETREHKGGSATFWAHMAGFALDCFLVGYLLIDATGDSVSGMLFYCVALALHLLVVDHSLREEHGAAYDRTGRWILAALTLVGWAASIGIRVSDVWVATGLGFVAGGVALNSLKDELPQKGMGRFAPFAGGALVYAVLLLWSGER